MKPKIKLAFLSGTDELNRRLIERMRALYPELPLWVVSDFPPEDRELKWVRYRVNRSLAENLRNAREELAGYEIRLAAVMLVPNVPFRRMRLMAFLLSPRGFLAFNENLNNFMLRPGSLPTIARHVAWRGKNALRWAVRASRKADWRLLYRYRAAILAGEMRPMRTRPAPTGAAAMLPGVTVVIPSRDGKELLAAQLPGILAEAPEQVIVVDNGSSDGTREWLAAAYPAIEVEHSPAPLSFARAVNRGIARAKYAYVCLLNNDMLIERGFFAALRKPFDDIPDLFSTTAQIRFPAGVRREETGKTVMAQSDPEDFPVRCDETLAGEDGSYVLYGSGGCSLYDAAKLHALGGVDDVYEPAYVEDLDLGYRAWQRGWPSVYANGAVVEHRHRTTTSRFYTEEQLSRILETNYLRFLARAVSDPALFRRLWRQAVRRLWLRNGPLEAAPAIALEGGLATTPAYPEERFLSLTDGSVSVFPGRAATGKMRIVVASPYLPFPLSHGGAVRMYNLMARAARAFDVVLVAFTEQDGTPQREVLEMCAEVVLVRRKGSHALPFTGRPEVVEEFASNAFRAALEQTVRKWRPAVVQLEFTQLAQYAADCAPAKTILVEHDITFDLYEQLLAINRSGQLAREVALWRSFETTAWSKVDAVVTMSEKDRRTVTGARAIALPNGVDLERFQPVKEAPEGRRILFIGSFAHRPNVMAVEFFVNEVWPQLRDVTLHVIAGARHEQFPVAADLTQHGIEVDGFVSDVRPAYRRATLVIAPLVASAGTNIKVLEAMAMGKAVVSTKTGVNGLDLSAGEDFVLATGPDEMAAAIEGLLSNEKARAAIELAARARVERDYSWDAISDAQAALYRELAG
ncbi:MAG: glycosyl transferase, family 2 [Candidatus Solibacter sp.]|nr:glycosyl transferase, family 2 [Candidatus Solibacter sp.]